ncbi:MAG: hypothetical protein FD180_3338 [Planctomycetota bacterium]|nr:MAG: hypothetical protein FD180_3338 [Planctomycetota bacterium]
MTTTFPGRPSPLILLLLALLAAADPVDPSIGVCTRKDDLAKRLAALDPVVAELSTTKDEAKRRKLTAVLVKAADTDIEALMRYREPSLSPVMIEVLAKSKKWFMRARAAYVIKLVGDTSAVPALVTALDDADPIVRETVATALGHIGGEDAKAALEKRKQAEKDPFVLATIEAALSVAAAAQKPYGPRADGKNWAPVLEGPDGAKRVAYAWVHKGQSVFNDYDAKTTDYPEAGRFVFPIQKYKEDLFAGYPRKSFGAGGNHAGEDCGWFREGCSYYAIADGVVRMVQGAGGDWGFIAVVEHRLTDGRFITSVYGHAGFDVLVKVGDKVRPGQKIATQGMSCAIENGGYGSHIHFGLGDGPFRRPVGLATGDSVEVDPGDGKKVKLPILRLVYAATAKNSFGWPLTAYVVKKADGAELTVEVPEQPVQNELGWFQAYVKGCRGWLDPQKLLPELVEGVAPKK